jgi:hypothetical protein
MDRTTRIRTTLRSLFAATLLTAPVLAATPIPAERYRQVRELRIKAPSRPKLSRVLERIEKSRQVVDEDVKRRRVSAEEARRLLKTLATISNLTFASAAKGRDLSQAKVETLDWELDQIHRVPSTKKQARKEHPVLAVAIRKGPCAADDESYDCLTPLDPGAGQTNDLISRR